MAVGDVDVSVPIEEEHVPQIIVSTIDHVLHCSSMGPCYNTRTDNGEIYFVLFL